MSRIKLFTHTDLDGVGCAVVAHHFFGENVDVAYCDYHNVNGKVSALLDDQLALGMYDVIYVTDISVNEEVGERINADVSSMSRIWCLLDHHATAEWMNKYQWAGVVVESQGIKRSGTDLFFRWLAGWNYVDGGNIREFVEAVRSYDTWYWAKTGDQAAKDLNDLFWLIGRDRFVERFTVDPSVALTHTERLLLEIERERINAYITGKVRQLTTHSIGGHTVGIVFADRYQSELGNHIVTERADIDFVAMIDPAKSVSYRTDGKVNVGLFAQIYGGGGHKNAAGSPVSDVVRQTIIESLYGGAAL